MLIDRCYITVATGHHTGNIRSKYQPPPCTQVYPPRAQPGTFTSRQLVTATVALPPVDPVYVTATAKGAIAGETAYPTAVADVDSYPVMAIGTTAPAVVANPMPVAYATPL